MVVVSNMSNIGHGHRQAMCEDGFDVLLETAVVLLSTPRPRIEDGRHRGYGEAFGRNEVLSERL